jgi:hypothetical protein
MSDSELIATEETSPFEDVLIERLALMSASREAEASLLPSTSTSLPAQRVRQAIFAIEESKRQNSSRLETVRYSNNIDDPEWVIAREASYNIEKLDDPLAFLRQGLGGLAAVRQALNTSDVAIFLEDTAVTIFPEISDGDLLTVRSDRGRISGLAHDMIVVLPQNGTKLSCGTVGVVPPEYQITERASGLQELFTASPHMPKELTGIENWLQTQQSGTNQLILLKDTDKLRLPDTLKLSDLQRYIFRIAIALHEPQLAIAIPKPDGSEFRDGVVGKVAQAFTELIHESASLQRSAPRKISGGLSQDSIFRAVNLQHEAVTIRDYDQIQFHLVLEAAGVEYESIAEATREKVAESYAKPTMTQIMERLVAQRNTESFLDAALGR